MLTIGPADLKLTNTRQLQQGDFFLLNNCLCRVIEREERQTVWVRLLAESPFTLSSDHDRSGMRRSITVIKLDLANAQFRLHLDHDSLEVTPSPLVGTLVVQDDATSILATWNEDGTDDGHGNAVRIDSDWERIQIPGGQQVSFTGWQLDYQSSDGEWHLLASRKKSSTPA